MAAFRLTLAQVMKLVVFCAVAFACLSSFVFALPKGSAGIITVAAIVGTTIPLAWACLSIVLIRPGPFRELFILGCLLCFSLTLFGVSFLILVLMFVDAVRHDVRYLLVPQILVMELWLGGTSLFFGLAAGFLAWRMKRRLPRAQRPVVADGSNVHN